VEGTDESWTTRAQDIATEAAVIQQLLHLHPAQLTMKELIREIGGERPSFAERDAIERAVRDLVGAGLLHRREDFLTPSRAALRLNQLLER
jgi:predicted transcriptional regulator